MKNHTASMYYEVHDMYTQSDNLLAYDLPAVTPRVTNGSLHIPALLHPLSTLPVTSSEHHHTPWAPVHALSLPQLRRLP